MKKKTMLQHIQVTVFNLYNVSMIPPLFSYKTTKKTPQILVFFFLKGVDVLKENLPERVLSKL